MRSVIDHTGAKDGVLLHRELILNFSEQKNVFDKSNEVKKKLVTFYYI